MREPNGLLVRLSSVTVTRGQPQAAKLATGRAGGGDSSEAFYRREYGQMLRLAWLLTNSEAARGFEGDIKRRALADLVEQHPVGLGQLLAVADSGSGRAAACRRSPDEPQRTGDHPQG
jgi:hypothetical protein